MLGGIILIKGLKSRKKESLFSVILFAATVRCQFPTFQCHQRLHVRESCRYNEKFTVRNCPVTDGYVLAAWVLLNTRITTDGLDLGKARCTVLVTQFQRFSFVASR